ncbi:CHAP domain-containing protein [Streptosporangium roseum]|uniref:CHAP domain-containing protein n=1 Tax=Streptosporangium roseum TaxID=2001 RepID=UPI001E2DEB37|nr:CHAP domain-containing protein [Streptosporangium roseum]
MLTGVDPIGENLLRVMEPELGYREQAGQRTTFGEWYSTNVVKDPQYRTAPWCDMVIAWAAGKAGVEDFVGQFAWTPSHARWFETRGAWSDEPEPGALVFFDWSGGKDIKGIDHVGVVERVEDGTLHTIEGNVDGVWLKRKTRDESKVVGYGLPRKVKEGLTGGDAPVPVTAGRIEAGAAAAGSVSASVAGRPETPSIPMEAAPVAGVLLLVLGATLVLARRRPRVPAAGVAPAPAPRPPSLPAGSRSRVETGGRHRRRGSGAEAVPGPSTRTLLGPGTGTSPLPGMETSPGPDMEAALRPGMETLPGSGAEAPLGSGLDRPGSPAGRTGPRQAVRHMRRQAGDGAGPARPVGARAGRRPYSP